MTMLIINENSEWQYTATKNVLSTLQYNEKFLETLSDMEKQKLRTELTHHLMTGLTAISGYLQLDEPDKALKALQKAKERYEWLIKQLTTNL
tara:strand:+ start:107 stop:382 length:276 start_codon:yes stop_codon:yes gene_type:complete